MRIFAAHIRFRLSQLRREPSYLASTMVFPALFFLIFALPNADTPEKARFLLASFTIFAVLGVCFFQFGIHQAQELRSGWHSYMDTLPAKAWQSTAAQWISGMVAALFSCLAVFLAVRFSTDLDLSLPRWFAMCALILIGSIPFVFFSGAIACWVTPWAALPIFNLLYILSSFSGGLWMPPAALPAKVEPISRWLPTRHLGEILWKFVLDQPIEHTYIYRWLAFLGITFVGLIVSRKFLQHQKI